MRVFNGRPLELLAPAGNMDIFRIVAESGCDALYFGGSAFNMRMIRKGFNFSEAELRDAVLMARDRGKKAYIAVNNLIFPDELESLKSYLSRLAEIRPDALIVQDFAVLDLVRGMGLDLPLHASVMMNVHNLRTIEALRVRGVNRVVVSREMGLAEVKAIAARTDVEIEYFTHGDMCAVHGAQCYYSSLLFGMSSNRGRCLKPCRWWFDVVRGDRRTGRGFPLAVRDLCLYPYIPELIDAGVTSFKLEGRMKEAAAVVALVEAYGDALDRYIAAPVAFDRYKDYPEIHEHRKRDLSTGYAFGRPGLSNLNERWEGTGKFYSTGKMFSVPTAERGSDEIQLSRLREESAEWLSPGPRGADPAPRPPRLAVRVQTVAQAEAALRSGADRLYLASDVYLPDRPFSAAELGALGAIKGGAELYLCLPRMMTERHFAEIAAFLPFVRSSIDGLLVSNLGAAEAFRPSGLPLAGDSCLNVCNPVAADFFRAAGVGTLAASPELTLTALAGLLGGTADAELAVHGPIVAMYLEHDLYEHFAGPARGAALEADAGVPDAGTGLYLENEAGRLPVRKDVHGRCHLFSERELCLLPLLDRLAALGAGGFRIEGQTYAPDVLGDLTARYRAAIDHAGNADGAYRELLASYPAARYSFGSLIFG